MRLADATPACYHNRYQLQPVCKLAIALLRHNIRANALSWPDTSATDATSHLQPALSLDVSLSQFTATLAYCVHDSDVSVAPTPVANI